MQFDPTSLIWTDLAGQYKGFGPTARWSFGLTCANSKLYLYGGYSSSGGLNTLDFCDGCTDSADTTLSGVMGDFWVFDIAEMKWTILTSSAPFANAARYNLGLIATGNTVNLFGGRGVNGWCFYSL